MIQVTAPISCHVQTPSPWQHVLLRLVLLRSESVFFFHPLGRWSPVESWVTGPREKVLFKKRDGSHLHASREGRDHLFNGTRHIPPPFFFQSPLVVVVDDDVLMGDRGKSTRNIVSTSPFARRKSYTGKGLLNKSSQDKLGIGEAFIARRENLASTMDSKASQIITGNWGGIHSPTGKSRVHNGQ
ncbi:hypothetical protein NPIL_303481 [Nephila pilipes]|uniref:Uncharacterized protein n=1 Tax=Nephila pilipes TaxID=299642 RepID=A0A8X6QKX0_NEPPI|nr:hypothetical protein NPIL_303481 [Nephila pilipes]